LFGSVGRSGTLSILDPSFFSGYFTLYSLIVHRDFEVKRSALHEMAALQKLAIPAVRDVPRSAFAGSTALKSVDFGADLDPRLASLSFSVNGFVNGRSVPLNGCIAGDRASANASENAALLRGFETVHAFAPAILKEIARSDSNVKDQTDMLPSVVLESGQSALFQRFVAEPASHC
jgi:hypothetical protein